MSSLARYQKAPADLSKGEIYQKLQAARRTQLRRRAEGIVVSLLGIEASEAVRLLEQTDGDTAAAVALGRKKPAG